MTQTLSPAATLSRRARQRGGFVIGMIVGLLIGLAVALGVALYIAKVPVPFVDKVPHRTPEQDAAELERNKNWDPNAPLAGKQAGKIGEAASAVAAPAPPPLVSASEPDKRPVVRADAASAAVRPGRDPAAILAGQSPGTEGPAGTSGGKLAGDPFIYFVQAGAYSNADDAEQQRARLAMQGLTAKVTEREQSGRTVYRVRLGPFNKKEEAEASQDRLKESGAEAVLVRAERDH
jgi:cell division septation protein DedD